MQITIMTICEAVMLAAALSMDAFIASFAYGTNKIKISFLSIQIVNIVCSLALASSLLVGSIVRQYVPAGLTVWICFTILFVLGVIKLLDSFTKTLIRKNTNIQSEIKFSMFNFKFILKLYADPEQADVNHSKTISSGEAASLALALSLDGIAVGFGAALGNVNVLAVLAASLITDAVAIYLGCFIGHKIANKLPFHVSWLSGALLILLAFMKLT